MEKDIQVAFGGPYARSAPKLLGDQHAFLLDSLESYLSQDPVLLVAGSGGQVHPYSREYKVGKLGESNRKRIKNMIGDGKLILLDYVVDREKNGLEMGADTLDVMRFFGPGFFRRGEITDSLDPESLEARTVAFLHNNLRDNLELPDECVDAIDANLSVHHASITKRELKRVYTEFNRVLKPGGILHLGEGEVDMSYTEEKLTRMGEDISLITGVPVFIVDQREKEITALFEPKQTYAELPVVTESPSQYLQMTVTENGMVFVKGEAPNQVILSEQDVESLSHELQILGYHQVVEMGGCVALPIIDPMMPEDNTHYIAQVNAYYNAIRERGEGYTGIDDKLVSQIDTAVKYERANALRGTTEYYMGEHVIVPKLHQAGFSDVLVTHHNKGPFYNILAFKAPVN